MQERHYPMVAAISSAVAAGIVTVIILTSYDYKSRVRVDHFRRTCESYGGYYLDQNGQACIPKEHIIWMDKK